MLYRGILNQRFCLYVVHGEALLDARAYVERVFSINQTGGREAFISCLYSIPCLHIDRARRASLTMVGTFVFLLLSLILAGASLPYLTFTSTFSWMCPSLTGKRKTIQPGNGCHSKEWKGWKG